MTEKKVTRKTTKKRAAPKKDKTLFEMLEESVVGRPIRIANRTFLASLGLVSTMQTEFEKFQADFGKTFDRLVKDGEKARERYRKEFRAFRKDVDEFRDEVVEEVVEVKDKIVENVSAVVD